MDFTCVEIKNVKYIKLIPLDRKCEKELDLTTIHRDQELAYLNIYHIDKDKKKTLLKRIEINKIRPGHSGIPELHLSVSYDGRQYYKIVLKLNGYIYHNSVIDIRYIGKSPMRLTNIALITVALILVSFLAFFFIRTLFGSREDPPPRRPLVKTGQNDKNNSSQTEAYNSRSSLTDTDSTDTDSTDTDSTDTRSTDTRSTDTRSTQAVDNPVESQTIETSELINNKAIVYFYPNSIVLTSEAKSVLKKILTILNENSDLDVEIFGHCAFFGTEKGRQEISTERAEKVYSFFINNGWTPESQPLLAGLGHKNIVTRDPEKQNLNRRVEITIMSKKEN